MLEWQLREAFIAQHKVPMPDSPDDPVRATKGHLTLGKRASDPGVDIDFLELAESFYELDAASGRAASSGSVALADVR